ncbi:MAG: putative endonuclease containing a domain [Bacteroidetes bacterium]|jgi:putative endonuclease|nr:putative endonuclease containing a domain [Bacteroidota bacterium]
MHYLYVIYSSSINKYYVGETIDVVERLQQHKSGYYAGSYTKQAIDWEFRLILEFDNISQARRAEAFIKRINSRIY